MLGRYQPWHDGHQALFDRAMAKHGQVHLMIRDMETDELLSVRFSLTGDPEETPIVYLPLPEEITSVPEDDRVSAKN